MSEVQKLEQQLEILRGKIATTHTHKRLQKQLLQRMTNKGLITITPDPSEEGEFIVKFKKWMNFIVRIAPIIAELVIMIVKHSYAVKR